MNPPELPTASCHAVFQQQDGLWRWREPAGQDTPQGQSPLSFRTAAEAGADADLHARATRDATGRRVLPKDYLRRLISAAALACPACEDVYFGGVYWHPRDAEGANWGVAIMDGSGDRAGCLAGIAAARDALRGRYAIVDEA